MSLRNEVQRVLTNGENRHINFNVYGLHVTSDKLSEVAVAVGTGEVQVRTNRRISPEEAEYSRDLKSIVVPWDSLGNDIPNQAMVIHEGVHAWCHIRHTKGRLSSEEIACFIAQAIYRIRNGDPHRPTGPGGAEGDNLFYYAFRAADTVIARDPLGGDDIEGLRAAILAHRLYRTLDPPPEPIEWSGSDPDR